MKLPKLGQHGITHILAPIAFIGIFAAIGGIVLLKSHAQTCCGGGGSTLQTQTVGISDVSRIDPTVSSGYQIVNDTFGVNPTPIKVAQIQAGGYINFMGGKGGTNAPLPTNQQFCYIMRATNKAKVKVAALDGYYSAQQVRPYPYDAELGLPKPYQRYCVTNAALQGSTTQDRAVHQLIVVSGGPVYFYGYEYLATFPY